MNIHTIETIEIPTETPETTAGENAEENGIMFCIMIRVFENIFAKFEEFSDSPLSVLARTR